MQQLLSHVICANASYLWRRPQWSVRALLLATALAAVLVSYVARQLANARRFATNISEIEAAGGSITFSAPRIAFIQTDWDHIPQWATSLFGRNYFAKVQEVSFFGYIRDGAQLKCVAQVEPQELSFVATELNQSHIADLAKASTVTRLSLFNTSIPGRSLKHLSHLRLSHLTLDGEQITDEWLYAFCEIRSLSTLSLGWCNVTPKGLGRINTMPNLNTLHICYCDMVTDSAFETLEKCPGLVELELKSLPITDLSCEHIAACARLRSVRIMQSQVTDQGLTALSRLPHLEELSVAECPVGDEGVALLSQIKQLNSLGLAGTLCTSAIVEPLKSLRLLRNLTIGPGVSAESAAMLKCAIPTCRITSLDDSGKIAYVLE